MKNWEKLEADVNCILSKHFTKGRSGYKVNKVVVHYNAGNLTVEGCYSVWQSREASAHYQVEDGGRIGQLVWDSDTAWHASNWAANCSSIGIEHANRSDGTISDACLDNGAHLVAAVCKYYGLGRPEWLKNVFPHKYFAATSCPGQIYGSQKDTYIQRAQAWYDAMNGGAQPSATVSAPSTGGVNLGTDLTIWGPLFTKEMQRQLGTIVDGVISGQYSGNKKYFWAVENGTVTYENTGISAMVKALQNKIIASGFSVGSSGVDGYMGHDTIKGHQQLLQSWGYSVGASGCDGYNGHDTNKAVAQALTDGKYR